VVFLRIREFKGTQFMYHELAGVYAAAVTPMKADFSPDVDAIPALLEFLARRGCHGVLLLGTTGEGPSFSQDDRIAIFRAAQEFKIQNPKIRLLAGTGTPSLSETINLTQAAFSFGFDGVVVLPPYYFRKVADTGLMAWFDEVIKQAIPDGGYMLGYHIPPVSGVALSLDLLARLKEKHPIKFAGIKDSSGDAGFARSLGERFGSDLLVLNGNDRLFRQAMDFHAAGCITALANLYSPELRSVWDEYQNKRSVEKIMGRIEALRLVLENYSPYPPILKAMLARQHGFPCWPVCPPLMPVSETQAAQAVREFSMVTGEV
jgi:4-hydroxy-tetrahydrodipicolinate synthase